jgi:hypothetical protein
MTRRQKILRKLLLEKTKIEKTDDGQVIVLIHPDIANGFADRLRKIGLSPSGPSRIQGIPVIASEVIIKGKRARIRAILDEYITDLVSQ